MRVEVRVASLHQVTNNKVKHFFTASGAFDMASGQVIEVYVRGAGKFGAAAPTLDMLPILGAVPKSIIQLEFLG